MAQLTTAVMQAAVAQSKDKYCTWTDLNAMRDTWNKSYHGPYDTKFIAGAKYVVGTTFPDPGPPPVGVPAKNCSRDPFSKFIPILVFGGGAASFAAPLLGGGAAGGAAPVTSIGAATSPVSESLLGTVSTQIQSGLAAIKTVTAAAGLAKTAQSLLKGHNLPLHGGGQTVVSSTGGAQSVSRKPNLILWGGIALGAVVLLLALRR